jgi:flagellar motor switch/type III secretory pathway protein FliN
MTSAPKAWLPADARSRERIQPLLERALEEWSDHWFASGRASLDPAFQDDWPGRSGDADWRCCPDVASLALTPAAEAAIAGTMLGSNVPLASMQSEDRTVVHHLARACAEDLLLRLARLTRGAGGETPAEADSANFDACSWWDVSVGARKGVLKLALSEEAEVQMVKRQLPSPAKIALESTTRGLARQQVEIEADLGRCEVSLAELEDLAVGDVLVLDTSSADPLALLIGKERSPLRASLEAREEGPFLILSPGNQAHA